MQIGCCLSFSVNSDFPPSGSWGLSSAHRAFRFALSAGVPVRRLRFSARGAAATVGVGVDGDVYAIMELEGVGRSGTYDAWDND